MLRTMILLVTHLSMLFAGAGLALITVRSRRQAVLADRAALDVRATFLESTIERQLRIRADAANPEPGRHRRAEGSRARSLTSLTTVQPAITVPSLLTASLAEATAILATQRAKREQERRQFVDIMAAAKQRTYVRAMAHVA